MPGKANIGTIDNLVDRNLGDQAGLQTRTLYIYQITNHKDKGFIKEQTLSILHIKQHTTSDVLVVRDEEHQTLTQENRENNSKGNTAIIVPRLSGMSYTTQQHIDEADHVLIGTLDTPLNINNGVADTNVYLIDSISRQLITPIEVHGNVGKTNPTDFVLTNIDDIRNNYNALKFLYTFDDEIANPTSVNLSLDNYSLLSKVMAKGEVDGKKHQDIDLEIGDGSSKLSLLTHTPTSTNYKLSLFSHWLDANRTLSFVKAKAFITKTNLKTLFDATNADFTGWSATEITDAYKVVISMMKLTQAYATNFKDYRTGSDNKIAGVINGVALADFADKNPMNAVDGFVEAWKAKYPGQVDSPGFKILTEVIAMLSNHINSSYAVAKGNNDFMKVYLPWYFVPQTAIAHTLAEDADFDVILKSEYFKLAKQDSTVVRTQTFTLPRGTADATGTDISFDYKYLKDNGLDFSGKIKVDIELTGSISGQVFSPLYSGYSKTGVVPITGDNDKFFSGNSMNVSVDENGVHFNARKDQYDDLYFIVKYTYKNIDIIFPLELKEQYRDISGYVAHDLNGWISQPELPNKIAPINKFAKPGDIDLKSDNDLKYLFYIPFINNQVLENLYGELHTSTQSGWHDEGIVRNYSKKLTGTFRRGSNSPTREERFTGLIKSMGFSDSFAKLNYEKFYNNQAVVIPADEAVRLLKLPLSSRLKDGTLVNITFNYTLKYGDSIQGIVLTPDILTGTLSFDYQLEVNGSQTISSIQHAGTIYDKLNWRSVSNNLTNGNDKYYLNLIPNHKFNLNIDKINELNIQAVWLDTLSLNITNGTDTISFTDVSLPSMDDETLTSVSILV